MALESLFGKNKKESIKPAEPLNPRNTVFLDFCSSCQDRHIVGASCPTMSTDWMDTEGNRVVKAISDQLDTWSLTSIKQPLLEAIKRFNEAWSRKDTERFRKAIKEIDDLLLKATGR